MTTLSPYHLTWWVFVGSLGYVIGQGNGLAVGLVIGTFVSGVISLVAR